MFDPQGFPNICTRNRISEDHIHFSGIVQFLKISIPTSRRDTENSKGEGSHTAKFVKFTKKKTQEFPEGLGIETSTTLSGRGMDILWNNTFSKRIFTYMYCVEH